MPIHHQDFNYLRQLVHHHSAMVLDADKAYLAELRLTPLATQMGFSSLGEMIANLQTQPFNQRHVQVVEGMLLTETSFFRDRYPFDALANAILPELLAKRQTQRTLNIWCAACSSGQEPYSIAMLLHEEFPELLNWKLRLIATDLSNEILNRAKAGFYSQLEVTRGLPLSLLNKYFQHRGNQWQICDKIRHRIEFQQLNLVTHSFTQFHKLDIIFLRNVLIYFDLATKKAVLEKIRTILAPDGYLFLGGGETTLNLDDSFERVQVDKAVCYRQRLQHFSV